jgi:ribonuclease Z
MDLDVVFVGTGGSVPTPRRGLSSLLVRRGGTRVLVDCGEGTQRQLMRSVGLGELDAVLLTHAHGDHVLGLPGMLKTFALRDREAPLVVAGPRVVLDLLGDLRRVIGKLPYPLELEELWGGRTLTLGDWHIDAFDTEHRVPSVGYRFREDDRPGTFDVAGARALGVPEGPAWGLLQRGESVEASDGTTVTPAQVLGEARRGRRVVVTGDTRPGVATREVSAGADLLVHEATFGDDEADRAHETAHSTARDAALVAAAADVRMLALTHFSNRYHGRELEAEAREVFPATTCARDFDLVELPFAERGEPRYIPGGARHGAQRDSVAAAAGEAAPT